MKSQKKVSAPHEAPIFDLHAFGQKATWTDFYIQGLRDHIREHDFIEKPHKHDFYLLMFVSQGSGVHTIDFIEYPIQTGSVFLMTPGQVHSWELSKDIDGFVMFFTREFYQMRMSENNLLEFPFFHSLVAFPLITTDNDEVLDFVLHQMHQEYANVKDPDLRIIRAYLDVFLFRVAKSYDVSHKATTQANTFKLRRLEQLIDENFRTLKQPSDYADLMNLAPGYLNSICKETLGKTLSDLIQQRILLEAKRMFAYSDLTVSEVAAKLNFADPSYFVRWFKKNASLTPEHFRAKNIGNNNQ